jgi:hypothetical protein
MTPFKATSFATFKDLVAYIHARDVHHMSPDGALEVGDNGTGAWGDVTAQLSKPMVALHRSHLIEKFGLGNSDAGRMKAVKVTLLTVGHCKPFTAYVADIAPEGLPADSELNTAALWEWA